MLCPGVPTGSIEALGISGRPVYQYSLDGGEYRPSPLFSNLGAGTYTLSILDQAGCENQIEITINDAPPYTVELGDTIYAKLGEIVQLNAVPSPFSFSEIKWDPFQLLSFNGDTLSPTTLPPGTTTYMVEVVNEAGCVATDEVVVFVEVVRPVYAPNVFSPNGDGINDLFFLSGGPAVEEIEALRVYDRWGGLVYEQTNIPIGESSLGWDGRVNGVLVNPGVFAFHARIRFVDLISLDYSGSITVIR